MSEARSGDATAIILAGGRGTRLASVVSDRPKPLADVGGRPFITRLLDQLAAANIRESILCTGHMGELIADELGDAYGEMRLAYSQEAEPLGTGGATRLAAETVTTEHTIVMNGDAYCDVDVADLLTAHRDGSALATILVTRVEDASRYGSVESDDGGSVTAFREKQPGVGAGWINAGVYVVATRRLLTIPAGRAVSLEREVFPLWVGDRFHVFRAESAFIDIGTPESYAAAEAFFRNVDDSPGRSRA
jgi:NDP-sugar pyrophosphorylase family protein